MKRLIFFLILTLALAFQQYVIDGATTSKSSIYDLEMSGKPAGMAILQQWHSAKYGRGSILDVAITNTRWDFFYIFCYVTLVLSYSASLMQGEHNLFLNTLLRLNLALVILAALFDIAEDFMLLHDFDHVLDGRYYMETAWVTIPKLVLAGWIVLVLIFTFAKSILTKTAVANSPVNRKEIAIQGNSKGL